MYKKTIYFIGYGIVFITAFIADILFGNVFAYYVTYLLIVAAGITLFIVAEKFGKGSENETLSIEKKYFSRISKLNKMLIISLIFLFTAILIWILGLIEL